MNAGRTVFSQIMDFMPHPIFRRCVERYRGNYKVQTFTCQEQFRCMAFAQLTYRHSLRDIEVCLRAMGSRLYHMIDDDGKGHFKTVANVEGYLDRNKRAINNESGNWKGDMHHIASIDPVTWQNWWNECGGNPMSPEHQPKLMKRLNDRDYCKFRVKSGRV